MTPGGSVWLFVTLLGSLWLCVALFGSVCLFVAVCASVGLFVALCGSVWLCVTVFGSVWLCVAMCGSVWLLVALCDSLWFFVSLCVTVWVSVALYCSMWLYSWHYIGWQVGWLLLIKWVVLKMRTYHLAHPYYCYVCNNSWNFNKSLDPEPIYFNLKKLFLVKIALGIAKNGTKWLFVFWKVFVEENNPFSSWECVTWLKLSMVCWQ